MTDMQFSFLLESYKSAVEYFDGLSGRANSRFNILVTVDVALAAVLGNTFINGQSLPLGVQSLICGLGLITALFLYAQSAQDKYIIKGHIARINRIRTLIEKELQLAETDALFAPLDETDTGKRPSVFEDLTSWRSHWFSLTRLPVWFSILLFVFWIITVIGTLFWFRT